MAIFKTISSLLNNKYKTKQLYSTAYLLFEMNKLSYFGYMFGLSHRLTAPFSLKVAVKAVMKQDSHSALSGGGY